MDSCGNLNSKEMSIYMYFDFFITSTIFLDDNYNDMLNIYSSLEW
jgi:hypothetical protein